MGDLTTPAAEQLRHLGMIDHQGRSTTALLDPNDVAALSALASRFWPYLRHALLDHAQAICATFERSRHARHGISFAEWYIWWYHFLYTAVTDRLIEAGLVALPPSGNTTYFTVRRRAANRQAVPQPVI